MPVRTSTSRSPHPYHRKSISLSQRPENDSSTDVRSSDAVRSSDSSEDHAIEADDEKGPLLRLPAPPIRGRKGLKDGDDPSVEWTPLVSPVPTPSVEKPGFSFTSAKHSGKPEQIKGEQDEIYAKYIQRRRAEVVRRVTETVLLLAVGLLSSLDRRAGSISWVPTISPSLWKWKYELKCFFTIFCSCYLLYPVRRALRLRLAGQGLASAVRTGFHVPSRFDPGILLYPVLLPLCIAASLGHYDTMILVNIILGLASMPQEVVPMFQRGGYYIHWALSIVPVSLLIPLRRHPSILKLHASKACTNLQEMGLLFPLHQNLVKLISDLVTTSLDPSEIQLLSAGLINLLVFATTPQSQILKALLWVGGLCLFVFCEFALKAEVSLARVPAWRFARNKTSTKGVSGRINRILQALLPEPRSRFALSTSSESEDEKSPKLAPPRRSRKTRRTALREGNVDDALHKTLSADDGEVTSDTTKLTTFPALARSATFSTYGRATAMAVKWRNIASSSNPYTRLNFLHAQALKYLLAVYAYVAVAASILLPVRYFISQRALASNEPIGWAIGYFVGDIPPIRMFVIGNNLEWWIKIPVNKSQIEFGSDAGWVEFLRRHVIGSANTRLLLAAYCVSVVGMGIVAVLQLNNVVEVDTRRKVFHGVMVAMLLPTIPIDPCFFALALMIVLAVFLMLDLFRASQLPPISRPLTNFLAPYIDGRDYRGPVIVSHIFLLIGCAIPLWFSLASTERLGDGPWAGWEVASRDLSMVSGVICVGMGDAAASLFGRRYGRTKWYWGGGKSIEGSVAFTLAVMIGLMASWLWLRIGGWVEFDAREIPLAALKALAAGAGASLMESTLTAANDNVVVPIGLWLLVRGLRI
ncbi:dolichol kinase [Knufia fluminis]|uniref:dolichol kinase n=1 Tax=Knufia fluminis TaxID=191047 RepID=A0AAN8ILX9_9EURO|nr:dolichol kinase [Knufia fluminis]